MTKPTVFNYQDYVALEAQIADLREKNDRLREKVANLEIRCRIAEEALTESQNNLLQLAMDRTWISSEDAVEVVRCRDCIHWAPHIQCGFDEDNDEYHDYCGLLIPDDDFYAYTRKPDDYCSRGERREEVKS